jgi:peptide/nickel transport system substrate-binding protein
MEYRDTTDNERQAPNGISRRGFLKIGAGATAALSLSSLLANCGPLTAGESQVIVAYGSPMVQLDPHKNQQTTQESVLRNMYDCLLALSPDLKSLEPQLATEWTRLDDLTVQFKLREKVKFHNGEDFDAEAVVFSFQRFADPATEAPYLSTFDTIDRVDVLDKYTINVVTKSPDPVLLRRLSVFHTIIVPPEYFSTASAEDLATKPVGTGPYKFVSWQKDEDLVMEVNRDYWGERPKIDKVIVRGIPEAGTRVSALLAGDVDIINAVPPEDIDRINASDVARVMAVEGNRVVFFYFVLPTEPLGNKLVRQAMNYGANVEGVIDTVLNGRGYRRATHLNPWYACYDPSIQPFPYDPEKAKALLDEAGYPDGFEINCFTSVGRVAKDKEVAEAIAGELGKIGITVNVQPLEWGTFVNMVVGEQMNGIWLASWGNMLHDPDGSLFTQYHSSTQAATLFNMGYENADLDALLEEARTTVDESKRCQLYTEAQQVVMDDPPSIFGYAIEDAYGVSKRIQWQARSDEMIWHKGMSVEG